MKIMSVLESVGSQLATGFVALPVFAFVAYLATMLLGVSSGIGGIFLSTAVSMIVMLVLFAIGKEFHKGSDELLDMLPIMGAIAGFSLMLSTVLKVEFLKVTLDISGINALILTLGLSYFSVEVANRIRNMIGM